MNRSVNSADFIAKPIIHNGKSPRLSNRNVQFRLPGDTDILDICKSVSQTQKNSVNTEKVRFFESKDILKPKKLEAAKVKPEP